MPAHRNLAIPSKLARHITIFACATAFAWFLNTVCDGGRWLRAADAPTSIDDEDFSAELPRIAPVEPRDAVGTFVVAPGFRVELVAAEPLVQDPIAMSFDENGRLYVVEMHDYSEDAEGRLGKIRLLTDTDGDGRFDTSTVFAENLSWPTAVICYDGGIFVGAAPDIVYCKDNDGDGHADVTQRVFTGFGRSNVQGLLNSFAWGLDNRIHGATSSSGATVRRADDEKAKPIVLSGAILHSIRAPSPSRPPAAAANMACPSTNGGINTSARTAIIFRK